MKVICMDAFKPEYLEYTTYLKSLTKKYQHGPLEVPTGFEGGMDIFFNGTTDILTFFYKSENSSLKWTRYFSFLPRIFLDILINLHRLYKNKKRFFKTYNIPKNKLYNFETSVNKTPKQFIKFEYKLISDLDKVAHKYGTTSKETIECIKRIDKMLIGLDFDLIFSDHGMIDIKEIISVPETKTCFIDGIMARYWDECPNLPLNKGKLIKVDKKYGDYVFLANPGILIYPNFWSKEPLRAMHGYSSTCRDMNGFYILKKPGKRKKLKMIDLHQFVQNNQNTQR